jgi:hypothetical protein
MTPSRKRRNVKADRPLDEHERGGDDAPGHHDPGQPPLRPDPVQQQIARDFEDRVADKEKPSAEGVRGPADTEVGLKLFLGEGDIASVEERNHIHQQQEWDQSFEDLPVCVLAQLEATLGGLIRDGVGHRYLLGRGAVGQVVQCMCLPPSI